MHEFFARTEGTDAAKLTRYVFVERPRCPVCGSIDLQTVRTERQVDETKIQRKKCRRCAHRFLVIWE